MQTPTKPANLYPQWHRAYIGSPWIEGVSDCWGFVVDVLKKERAIEMPSLKGILARQASVKDLLGSYGWRKVERPLKDFDILIFTGDCRVGEMRLHSGLAVVGEYGKEFVLHLESGRTSQLNRIGNFAHSLLGVYRYGKDD